MSRRYSDASRGFASAHDYAEDGSVVLEGREPVVVHRDTLFRDPVDPAAIPKNPQGYRTNSVDTMPLLAHTALDDPTQWWRIADVNPHVWYPWDLRPATTLRFPS